MSVLDGNLKCPIIQNRLPVRDEARRIAANIAKLPGLLGLSLSDDQATLAGLRLEREILAAVAAIRLSFPDYCCAYTRC
jgi:hypothetical protein